MLEEMVDKPANHQDEISLSEIERQMDIDDQ